MYKEIMKEAYHRALSRLLEDCEDQGFSYMIKEEDALRVYVAEEAVRVAPEINSFELAKAMGICRGTLRQVFGREGERFPKWKKRILAEG